ncbi:hypothetical protein ABIQ69_15470 [Agromyces sp. G08B096]|uniref:Head-to-tail adaptor n=1 Tax=Agromyces sp. G08B096 TaxID=3156399 RepID=A0AAU7W8G1_9MICO
MASAELIARLTSYVKSGAAQVSTTDQEFIEASLTEAEALVVAYVGAATVPQAVLDRATIEVGSELFNRRAAPNGISQFAGPDGSAIRVARDPMVGAYPILQPYLPLGFA